MAVDGGVSVRRNELSLIVRFKTGTDQDRNRTSERVVYAGEIQTELFDTREIIVTCSTSQEDDSDASTVGVGFYRKFGKRVENCMRSDYLSTIFLALINYRRSDFNSITTFHERWYRELPSDRS